MTNSPGLDFLVNKRDWKQHRFDEAAVPELGDGQVLFRVDRFAFTANNISYALAGDMPGAPRQAPVNRGGTTGRRGTGGSNSIGRKEDES